MMMIRIITTDLFCRPTRASISSSPQHSQGSPPRSLLPVGCTPTGLLPLHVFFPPFPPGSEDRFFPRGFFREWCLSGRGEEVPPIPPKRRGSFLRERAPLLGDSEGPHLRVLVFFGAVQLPAVAEIPCSGRSLLLGHRPSPLLPCQAIQMLMGALALHVPTGTPGLLQGQGDPEDPSGPRRRPPGKSSGSRRPPGWDSFMTYPGLKNKIK